MSYRNLVFRDFLIREEHKRLGLKVTGAGCGDSNLQEESDERREEIRTPLC
jgi:hypothetical protein